MNSVMVTTDDMNEAQLAEARAAGASVHEGWELRVASVGRVHVYLSTTGWWGIAKIGEAGRVARRRTITAAVKLASRQAGVAGA